MNGIAYNWAMIKTDIEKAAISCGRNPADIQVLAVTKNHNVNKLLEAHAAGFSLFGENYLQEAIPKMQTLHHLPLQWHFIGRIQRNKTTLIAANFAWVHSVDRLFIAERLSQARLPHLPPLQICLEINIDQESTKAGIKIDELQKFAEAVATLPQLQLRGLMVLPALTDDKQKQLRSFKKAHTIFTALQQNGFALDTLSMGTSHDFAPAIIAGSTLLRLGTLLLGERTNE